jgi:hypothetical protein
MTTSNDSTRWTVDTQSPLVTHHTAKYGRWTLLVLEYPKRPTNAPEGYRYSARVFSTHGTVVALKPIWCASLDEAKQTCITQAGRA